MTEAEWLTVTDPQPMLEFLRGKVSDRKLRLFSVVCCRSCSGWIMDQRLLATVELIERFADGAISQVELDASRTAAIQAWHSSAENEADVQGIAAHAVVTASYPGFADASNTSWQAVSAGADPLELVAALRDIFGNPLRPVTVDPAWRTSAVLSIARLVYDTRDFTPLPILADALQDAGCDNPEVLDHCRSGGLHARGCWVLDLLLGKE